MHRLCLLLLLLCAVTGSVRAADPPPQKFVVFFQEWSAAMDDPAQEVVHQAALWLQSNSTDLARVDGFADPTGSREANVLLSDLCAQVVLDQLVNDGVDPRRMEQRGHGPVQFALSSQESRRVEISIVRR
jgi:outer membrane protein OmpA-like peptidoglycan-associated protein